MEFPILYNKDKGRKWKIWTNNNIIFRANGMIKNEKFNKPTERKVEAKSHTTVEEQTQKEAHAFWVKKVDEGFEPLHPDECEMYKTLIKHKSEQGGNNHGTTREKKGSLKNVENNTIKNLNVKYEPMLAHPYEDKQLNIVWSKTDKNKKMEGIEKILKKRFPTLTYEELQKSVEEQFHIKYFDGSEGVFCSTKLDGIRCVAFMHNGEVALCTRTGKQIVFLKHIRDEIKKFLNGKNYILDGELYVHKPIIDGTEIDIQDRFSFISSCCRTALNEPNKHENLIEYHIFDVMHNNTYQSHRIKILKDLLQNYNGTIIKPVELKLIEKPSDILKYHTNFFERDYEGVILRDPLGYYESKRSIHLLKYKQFSDFEFKIVGAESAKGTEEGAVIWVCETNDKKKFQCRMRGTFDKRKYMFENMNKYINKLLTVRFQELSKDGIPRFPVGIAIRDYE